MISIFRLDYDVLSISPSSIVESVEPVSTDQETKSQQMYVTGERTKKKAR